VRRSCYARFLVLVRFERSLGCPDADASSVPHQAAPVDLQRAGVRDSRQRAYRVVEQQLQRSKKPATLRGLNDNHNLKDIFKGAAMRASTAAGPLRDFYEALLAKRPRLRASSLAIAIKRVQIAREDQLQGHFV
jgi:hypothetical protein